MTSEVFDRSVVEGADGGVLDGSHHALGLLVGLGMIGRGEPVLDVVRGADTSEDRGDKAALGPQVMLDELPPRCRSAPVWILSGPALSSALRKPAATSFVAFREIRAQTSLELRSTAANR